MKVLSILQPWASLVVTTDPKTGKAYKQIETRSWDTKFRGPLLIHASKKEFKPKKSDYDFIDNMEMAGFQARCLLNYQYGAIIGMVKLVGTEISEVLSHNLSSPNYTESHSGRRELKFGNYEPGRYGWLLSEPILFKNPIHCKGNLSIWNLPKEFEGAVINELEEATGNIWFIGEDGFPKENKGPLVNPYTPSLIASPAEVAVIVEGVKECENCGKPESDQALADHHAEKWCYDCMRQAGYCLSCDAYIPDLVDDYYNYESDMCPECEQHENNSLAPLPASQPDKTVGQIITEAISLHDLVPETVERVLGFPKGHIRNIMNDEIYTNSVPVILFKNLLLSLHIRFCDIEPAFIPTYKLLKSKETEEDLKKKPPYYMLWENEEALYKYTSRLNELMVQPAASQPDLPSRGTIADGHDQLIEELRKPEIN